MGHTEDSARLARAAAYAGGPRLIANIGATTARFALEVDAVDRPEEEGAQQNDAVAEVYIPVRCGHGDMDKHRCGAGQRGKESGKNKLGEFIVFHIDCTSVALWW